MAALPSQAFPPVTPPAVASYSFQNIIDGSGIVVFYVTGQADNSTTTWRLLTDILPTRGVAANRVMDGGVTYTPETNAFNTPRIANGDATISMELEKTGANFSFTATIAKVDKNAVVTNISSTITSDTASVDAHAFNLKVPLTKTQFGKGDKIRVTLVMSGAGSKVWADPVGTNGLPAKVLIPFDVRL